MEEQPHPQPDQPDAEADEEEAVTDAEDAGEVAPNVPTEAPSARESVEAGRYLFHRFMTERALERARPGADPAHDPYAPLRSVVERHMDEPERRGKYPRVEGRPLSFSQSQARVNVLRNLLVRPTEPVSAGNAEFTGPHAAARRDLSRVLRAQAREELAAMDARAAAGEAENPTTPRREVLQMIHDLQPAPETGRGGKRREPVVPATESTESTKKYTRHNRGPGPGAGGSQRARLMIRLAR